MNVLLAAASIAQSVVLVVASPQGGSKTGTGFAIASTSSTTRILTAAHVVEGATSPVVYIGGPKGQHYPATILQMDPLRDIALLQIPLGGMPTISLDKSAPVSGTPVETMGFPTLAPPPPADPKATPAPLPLGQLQLISVDAKLDGEAEEGESILLNVSLTHGDSGGPIVDASTGQLYGMVLGLGAGYGVAYWMTGDGLGLSEAAISVFLAQSGPPTTPTAPAFNVAVVPNRNPDVTASWSQLATSAGFTIANGAGTAQSRCVNPSGAPIANAVIEEVADSDSLSLYVADCSGASYYDDSTPMDINYVNSATRLLERAFLGYIDTHTAEWQTLLKYGIAIDPKENPYLALMSVGRNPSGQLIVTHIFRDGPADRAGLQQGDAIVKIDGRPTRALADFFIARLLDQPEVTLTTDRDEREFSVRIKLTRFAELVKKGPIPR